jgi:hypothetical protein
VPLLAALPPSIYGLPVLAPPAELAGCTLTSEEVSEFDPSEGYREITEFDAEGRWVRMQAEDSHGAWTGVIVRRDASGCPVDVRRWEKAPGDEELHEMPGRRSTCHPDGSLATTESFGGVERWAPPVAVDGGWVQYGAREGFRGRITPLTEAWTPVGERGVKVQRWAGGVLQLELVIQPGAGPRPTPTPLFDTLLGRDPRGVGALETDAAGRLLRWGTPNRRDEPQGVALRWTPAGPGGEAATAEVTWQAGPLSLSGDLRCGAGGCVGGPGVLQQRWSCPAR